MDSLLVVSASFRSGGWECRWRVSGDVGRGNWRTSERGAVIEEVFAAL